MNIDDETDVSAGALEGVQADGPTATQANGPEAGPEGANGSQQQSVGAAIPRSATQMAALRKVQRRRSINSLFEDLYLVLIDTDEKYAQHLESIHDSEAIQGSVRVDRMIAAQIAQSKAIKDGLPVLQDQNLTTFIKCQNDILRIYGLDRKTRRLKATRQV